MCAQSDSRDTFDRLASEYDELKLRVIPGYRQVTGFERAPRGAVPPGRVSLRDPSPLKTSSASSMTSSLLLHWRTCERPALAPAEVIWSWEKFAVFFATKPIPGA